MQHLNPIELTDLTKQTRLTLSETDLSPAVDPVLSLIHTTRQQLLKHQVYRDPYLKCLNSLYETGTASQRRHLRKIRPTVPTDGDIHGFISSQWPEVRLKKRRDYIPINSCDIKKVRPLDDAIHVNRGLAAHLVEKELSPKTNKSPLSLAELKVAVISILLYDLGRLLVSWWCKSDESYKLNEPRPSSRKIEKQIQKLDMATLDRTYWWYIKNGSRGIQDRFFGGAVEFWSRAGAKLKDMQGIGIEYADGHGMLDPQTAAAILHEFTGSVSATKRLPLLNPTTLTSPFRSRLYEIASRKWIDYYSRVINGKRRSNCLLIAPYMSKLMVPFNDKVPQKYLNTWIEEEEEGVESEKESNGYIDAYADEDCE